MASERCRAMPDFWLICCIFIVSCYTVSLVSADCNPFDKRYLFETNKSIEYCTPCTIRQSKLNEGCELKLRCKPGYFARDPDYADGQKLRCKDGTWTNPKTGQPATIQECVVGCKALMPNDINGMLNATFVYGPPAKMYKKIEWEEGYQELYYWEVGVRVETKCKAGYSFEDEHNRKRGVDNYRCDGSLKWYDLVLKDGETGQRPAACKPNCDAIDENNLPPGVAKVIGPKDGDFIKDSTGNKVYYSTIYKFKCANGQANAEGREGQMLICKGGSDGYYDTETGKIRAQVMSCSKNSCERITRRDLSIGSQITTQKVQCGFNSERRYTEGCKFAIKCIEGYYMAEAEYTEGQKIVCTNGAWVEENKVKQAAAFKAAVCQQGCKVLREDNPFEMGNATFIGSGKPSKSYKHEEFEYWPSGTVVETKCKNGFAFDDEDNRKRGQDKHICINGEWYDFYQNKSIGTRPGLCPPLCNAIDERDLPTGVNITLNPANFDGVLKVGEKGYVYSGVQYKFKCIEGYQYPNGKNDQTLICRGGELKYYDPAVAKNQATINECVPSGCTIIQTSNIDINATIVSSNRVCANPISSSTVPTGCELLVKCHEETHYFENIDYTFGQKLICKDNAWVDQAGKKITNVNGKYTDVCKLGCKALTDSDMVNATYIQGPPVGSSVVHKNGETVMWSQGVVITTKCKKFYARIEEDDRHNEPNSYICSGGNGWVNTKTNEGHQHPGLCEPMCVMPTLTPGTSYVGKVDDSLISNIDNTKYIYSGIVLRLHCDEGYELPQGITYPSNEQQLLCKGGPLGYYDIAKGKNNAVPVTCVKSGAPGCNVIAVSESTTEITKDGCSVKDGLENKGCKVSIKCKKGYYPDVSNVLEKGVQTLECKAGNDGWLDVKTNVKNTVAVTCQPVCPNLKNMDRIDIVQGPNDKDTIKDGEVTYIRSKTVVTIKCKNGFIASQEIERKKGNVPFECFGGPNKPWLNKITGEHVENPDEICKKTCDTIMKPGDNVVIISTPPTYEQGGKTVVIEDDSYTLKCEAGYKYEPSSPPAKSGRQTLTCVGGPDGYRDPDTKKNNADKDIAKCVRGTPQGCSPFDVNSPPLNVRIVESSGCSISNGLTAVGCKAKLECAGGYYTRVKVYSNVGYKQIECVDDGKTSKWIDQFKQPIVTTNFLDCVPGCDMLDNLQNAVYIHREQPTEKSGSKSLYKQGAEAIVKCRDDAVLADGPLEDSDKPVHYECRGGPQGWYNKNTSRNEPTPGSRCVPVCPTPMHLPEGVRVISKPTEFLYKEKMVVKEGGTYLFKCTSGYHYPKDTPYVKDNLQKLVCDGTVRQYRDEIRQNTTTLTVQYCESDVGPGCKDIPQENAYIESERCSQNVTSRGNGCEMVVKCKHGYYPVEASYRRIGKQELTCKQGKEWIDQNGKVITEKLNCVPGCVMNDADKKVSKIVQNSGQIITVENFIFYPQGTEVQVVCQGPGVVWSNNVNLTGTPHAYRCRGGEYLWDRKEDRKTTVTLGDGCARTCPLGDMKIPNSVQQVQSPDVFEYNGELHIVEGSAYVLKCRPKYAYRERSRHAPPNKQTLICNGDTRKLEDKEDSSNVYAIPESCVRSGQNECQEIPQNPQTTIVDVKNCAKDGDYYPTGCQIELSCKPGYYPAEDEYQKGKGSQVLICQGGGRGWFDQFYQKIRKPLKCVQGCIKKDVSASQYKNAKTVTANYVIAGETVKCSTYELYKNHSIVTGLLSEHNFYCAATDDHGSEHQYVDKSCTNACAQLESSLSVGVKLYKAPVIHRIRAPNGKYYIANKGEYVFKCDIGYQYKPDTIYYKKKRQALRCNGKTHTYDDFDTKKPNATIEPCVETEGCQEIRQDPTRTTISYRGCSKRGSTYSAGCEILVKCKGGSYPQPDKYLYNGYQKLQCSADGSEWKDQFGSKVDKPLQCEDGCVNPSNSLVAEKPRKLRQSYISKEFTLVSDEEGSAITKCVTVEAIRRVLDQREEIRKSDHRFYCNLEEKIKNDTSEYYYDDFCENACTQLMVIIPPNVEVAQKPETFKHGPRNYVREGDGYILKCKAGFMYPAFSPSSQTGRQKLVCNGHSHRYDDVDSRIPNAPILSCVEVQGCKDLPAPKPGTVVNKVGCVKTSGLYRYGCKISSYCEEGYYPTDDSLLSGSGQELYCNNGYNEFVDEHGNSVDKFMECKSGCVDKGHSVFKKISSSTKREFTTVIDAKGKVVSKCASVESIRRESEVRGLLNPKFLCPSNTTEIDKTNSYYVDYCENACRILQEPLPYGVRIIKKPFTFRHGDYHYTSGSSVYQLACKSGFVFSPDSIHGQKEVSMQTLKCDGKTHKYVDSLDPTNTVVSVCVKVEGCKPLRKPGRGMNHNQDQCTTQGKGIAKGCEVVVACDNGYYPASERYLVPGKQILKCAKDGSGWVDQFGILVGDAIQCKMGCVKRSSGYGSVSTERTSIEQTYNFIFGDQVVQIYCSYKSVSKNVDTYYLGEGHGFFCKSKESEENHLSLKNVTISPCSNACKALVATTSVKMTSKVVGPPIMFDGAKYVRDGHVYTFQCVKKGYLFISKNSTKTRKLVCDGKTGSYKDADSGEIGTQNLVECVAKTLPTIQTRIKRKYTE